MLSMSASTVAPTAPLYALMRTFCVPSQIMLSESMGLASLHTKLLDGSTAVLQVLTTLRSQTGVSVGVGVAVGVSVGV